MKRFAAYLLFFVFLSGFAGQCLRSLVQDSADFATTTDTEENEKKGTEDTDSLFKEEVPGYYTLNTTLFAAVKCYSRLPLIEYSNPHLTRDIIPPKS